MSKDIYDKCSEHLVLGVLGLFAWVTVFSTAVALVKAIVAAFH